MHEAFSHHQIKGKQNPLLKVQVCTPYSHASLPHLINYHT
jgi:hypothetical protein